MSDLGFTKEERDYVELVARDRHGVGSRLGFYAAILSPLVAFGIYGLLKRDFVAEFIAFAGLAGYVCWRIFQETSRVMLYKSVFRKVAEHERQHDRGA